MISGLRIDDDGGVQYGLVVDLACRLLGLLDDAVDDRTIGSTGLLAELLEDLLQTSEEAISVIEGEDDLSKAAAAKPSPRWHASLRSTGGHGDHRPEPCKVNSQHFISNISQELTDRPCTDAAVAIITDAESLAGGRYDTSQRLASCWSCCAK